MSRITALVSLTAAVLVLHAGPAVAQRDPFEPAVVAQPAGSERPATDQGEIQPQLEPPPSSDRLAGTGIDPRPWLGLAYLLTAAGFGVTLVGRLHPTH